MTQRIDPVDELIDIFVTEGSSPGGESIGTSISEVALVGSLPVRASLWVSAYGDSLGRESGPGALVRLDEERPSLHLLRGTAGRQAHRWPSLRDAVADLGPEVAVWIVRPAPDAAPPEIVACGADRITILTSVNEMAKVDAYQRIAALAAAAEAAGRALPPLGVAMIGAERRAAAHAHEAIAATARTHLAVELPLVACVQRIDEAVRTTTVQSFDPAERPDVSMVLRWIEEGRLRAARGAPARSVPDAEAEWPAEPVDVRVRQPAPAADQDAPESAAPTMKLPPKPSVELEPKEPAAGREPHEEGAPIRLATFVEDVSPLDVRCPGHERLEIAADAAGRLHVIAREADMRDLHVVEAWARAHRELIAKACPGHWLDPSARTVCHVFTEHPATLADLHGSDLRLHVLAPVTVEGRRGWYAAPLNKAVR